MILRNRSRDCRACFKTQEHQLLRTSLPELKLGANSISLRSHFLSILLGDIQANSLTSVAVPLFLIGWILWWSFRRSLHAQTFLAPSPIPGRCGHSWGGSATCTTAQATESARRV